MRDALHAHVHTAWTNKLRDDRARVHAALGQRVLLDPTSSQLWGGPDNVDFTDARVEHRFVANKSAATDTPQDSGTPWRPCQMIASLDEDGAERVVRVDAHAFDVVTASDDGSDRAVRTLAHVFNTLPHRFPSAKLGSETSLCSSQVACRLRTALVPQQLESDMWRTELRVVVHRPHRPAFETGGEPNALLLAHPMGMALDVERTAHDVETLRDGVTPSQPVFPTCLVEDPNGGRSKQNFAIDVTDVDTPEARAVPLHMGPQALHTSWPTSDGTARVAWQISVPLEPLPPEAPARPSTPVARTTVSKAYTPPHKSNQDDQDILDQLGLEAWSDDEADIEDERCQQRPKRARYVGRPPAGVALGSAVGEPLPLPTRRFARAEGAIPVATGLRVAYVRMDCPKLYAERVRAESRVQDAMLAEHLRG